MKKLIQTLFLPMLISCSNHAFAQSVFYVRLGSPGSNDGSSWSKALAQFPAGMQRGATYFIAAGNYSKQTFSSPEAAAQTITIKKATEADHGTTEGWQSGYGNGVAEFTGIAFESDWWVLDGGERSGPSSGYGIKVSNPEDRVSTVSLPGKRSQITLRRVELTGDPTLTNRGSGIYGVQAPSHIHVEYCYLHDFFGVPFHFIDASHVTIEHCLIARNKSTPEWHSEGIQARGCTDLTVRYNTWEDINGTAVIVSGSGDSSGWSIHGNVFNRGDVGHGIVSDNMVDSIENVTVSGNIIIGHRGNAGMNFYKAKGRITVVDNVWYDNSWVSFSGIDTRDYNFFSRCRFPYAFKPQAHETPVKDGKDGKYSNENAPPFADMANGDFKLSQEALQMLTREKK